MNIEKKATLKRIAKEMQDEADNLSPTGDVHPAPRLRRWADELLALTKSREMYEE